MSSVYSEVTGAYFRDRVLEKFDTAANTLPYTLNDIKISHNDYLIGGTYNDTITKLYKNWLWLIANAEIYSNTSPTTSVSSFHFNNSLTSSPSAINTAPAGSSTLSTINEVHYIKSPNTSNGLVFSYGENNSYIFRVANDYTSTTGLLSGNLVEFNKQFEFSNVVSVATADDFLFVLDKGNNTLFKFDISGLLYDDPAIQRTSINDTTHPGRYLIKTIGGKGKVNRKNKLTNPAGISIYNNEIYVLDNGNFSIKVYDLNFNFVRDLVDKDLFLKTDGNYPVSISVSIQDDITNTGKVYILSSSGTVTTYNLDFSGKQTYNPFGEFSSKLDSKYYEHKNFKKIISSPSDDRILYVTTNRSVIKFYKTNISKAIGFFSINLITDEFLRGVGISNINKKDNLSITSTVSSTGSTKYSFYKDETVNEKLYHDNFYTNYFSLSSILIKPQELVNAVTFNKTTEKIFYNHSALQESICKKIYSQYNTNRVAEINQVIDSTFDKPDSFNNDVNFYIGLNEPILTDIINRPIEKLYQQQVDIFDSIKEVYLNSNPPVNVPEILESKTTIKKLQSISLSASSTSLTAGDGFNIIISRDSTVGSVSCALYTTEGTNTLSSDYTSIPYVSADTIIFDAGVDSITAGNVFETYKFYSGDPKSFNVFISDASADASINQSNYRETITFTRLTAPSYTIDLSGNYFEVLEGESTQLAIIRSNPDYTYNEELSCNIYTSNNTSTDSDYVTIETDNTFNLDIPSDIAGHGYHSVSAVSLTGGTILFEPGVSAVYFSVSAERDTNAESTESFKVNIKNPGVGSIIGTGTKTVYIKEKPEPVSITIDDTFSTHTAGKVAGANVWEVLSANTTYQDISAIHPVSATLTIAASLSVYSNDIDKGAIYFDTEGKDGPLAGSILRIVNPTTSYIIGKGGNGGGGIAWSSGSNFADDTDPSYIETVSDDDYSGVGQDGGPAISLTGFDEIQISNTGNIWGGAGGGGTGYLPVTAANMTEVNALSASSGGGGGIGIAPDGFGAGGVKYTGADSFVSDGSAGSQTAPGAGGTINLGAPATSSTQFLVMSGAPGGNYGLPGGGGDNPDNTAGYHASYSTVYDELKVRRNGGSAGRIVENVYWPTKNTDITTGTFLGSDV